MNSNTNQNQLHLPKPQSPICHPSQKPPPRFFTLLARTAQEQTKIRTNLTWRQGTSMPIVKVVNYTCQAHRNENGEGCYWVFQVEVENIVGSVWEFRELDVVDALYLVREYLLGIQTISIKFNCQFHVPGGFFGVNAKGQGKVWSSVSFMQEPGDNLSKSLNYSLRKVNHAISDLFDIVTICVKPTQKAIFQQIGFKLAHEQNITYSQAHNKLRKLCQDHKLTISNSITLDLHLNPNQNPSRPDTKLSKLEKEKQKKGKKLTPFSKQGGLVRKQGNFFGNKLSASIGLNSNKVGIRNGYNSPTATEKVVRVEQKWQPISSNKPKVTWKYTNSATNQHCPPSISQNRDVQYKVQTVNNSIRKDSYYPSIQGSAHRDQYHHLCHSVPIKFEPQPRLNSDHTKIPSKQPRDEVTIKQFNPLQEADQELEASRQILYEKISNTKIQASCVRTVNTSNTKNQGQKESKIQFEESLFFQGFQCGKKSSTTTQVSSNTMRGKDSIQDFKDKCYSGRRLEEMIDNTKNIMDSIMIPSPLMSRRAPQASRTTTYNFGGLIPIQIQNSSHSEIEGKQVQSLQASRDISIKAPNSNPNQPQALQPSNPKIDFDLLCGIDLMAKFFTDDNQDLKESVWCGEERRASHLQVKLEKLGHFGRDISASFVPNQ